MRRIKLILAVATAMATLLAMAAAPAVANDWEDDWDDGCIGVVQGGECIGVGSVDNDWHDCDWDECDGENCDWHECDSDHLDRNNVRGLSAGDLDDCFWWDGDLLCEVDF